MSIGGSSSSQKSKSDAYSYYDPTQAGLVNSNATGLAGAIQNPNSNISYKPYSGPGLNFGDPAQLQNLTNYQAPQVAAGQIGSTDLSRYMNPFTQGVIDTTNADLSRDQAIAGTGADAQATAAGAFGGSRSAVLRNLSDDSYIRAKATADAGLRQAGLTQAQGAAGQDIASRLAADQGNQQADLASAQTKLQALGINAQQAQAVFGANWAQYINSQQDPQQLQALLNQAFSLTPQSPLQKSTSTGSGSSFGFTASAPAPK